MRDKGCFNCLHVNAAILDPECPCHRCCSSNGYKCWEPKP